MCMCCIFQFEFNGSCIITTFHCVLYPPVFKLVITLWCYVFCTFYKEIFITYEVVNVYRFFEINVNVLYDRLHILDLQLSFSTGDLHFCDTSQMLAK